MKERNYLKCGKKEVMIVSELKIGDKIYIFGVMKTFEDPQVRVQGFSEPS